MRKLNKKHGFSLIEVLCAMCVLSILLSYIAKMQLNSIKLNSYNIEKNKYLVALEAVKEEILYNYSYEDIKGLLCNNKSIIQSDNLTIDIIKNSNLLELFSVPEDMNNTYLKIGVEDGSILKITLELHYVFKSRGELYKCTFFKGNYI